MSNLDGVQIEGGGHGHRVIEERREGGHHARREEYHEEGREDHHDEGHNKE